MHPFQKLGALAAVYLAAAYLAGMTIFLVVLDYPAIRDPAQKAALLVENQTIIFATNLLLYVFFGVLLVVLTLALYERLKAGAPALMAPAAALGLIWAGSLIAAGMVSNAAIAPVTALYAVDPAQAALTWQTIEAVSSGLGNGNGEILGGLMTLLVGLAGRQTGGFSRRLNVLGVVVGALGVLSIFPGLADLVGGFGLGQMLWFIGLAVALLRREPAQTAPVAAPVGRPIEDGKGI